MKTASPGATSRSTAWPVPSSATDSLATMTRCRRAAFGPPHSGRMPYGSRNASRPWPAISAITAYEPLMRRCTRRTAVNTSSGCQRHVARAAALQLVRQHVEQHLGVALGVDVAAVDVEQLGLQRVGVGQVAVVHQHDAEGRVHVERLRLFFAVGIAGRRVAHLAQAHRCRAARACCACGTRRAPCRLALCMKHLRALHRDDAGRVLAAVLQQQQRVVDQLVDGCCC
jgi:hypothetical protein